MVFAIVLGTLTTLAAALIGVAYLLAPTHARCPECGAPTATVVREGPWRWLSPRWVQFRWCAVCTWEGWGRSGPERIPGRRTSHASGFHWGQGEMGEDLGFQWHPPAEARPTAEPPHHPSGFRFSAQDLKNMEAARKRAHPSGFQWGQDRDVQGFRWKEDAS